MADVPPVPAPDPSGNDDPRSMYRLDRTAFSVGSVSEQSDEGKYWRTRTPEERIRAMLYMRWMAYGDAANAPLQRVLTVGRVGDP